VVNTKGGIGLMGSPGMDGQKGEKGDTGEKGMYCMCIVESDKAIE